MITVTTRKNDIVTIKAKAAAWIEKPAAKNDYRGIRAAGADLPAIVFGNAGRIIEVGDEGILVTREDTMTGEVLSAWMVEDAEGIPGNSDPAIRRMHGWRGTTNGVALHAHGWRRVEAIEERENGSWIVTLSKDLKPGVA